MKVTLITYDKKNVVSSRMIREEETSKVLDIGEMI
jgi:hypothetical protein